MARQLVLEKENSEFKPVKLRLKIDLVSYPARVEGLGKYDPLKVPHINHFFFSLLLNPELRIEPTQFCVVMH